MCWWLRLSREVEQTAALSARLALLRAQLVVGRANTRGGAAVGAWRGPIGAPPPPTPHRPTSAFNLANYLQQSLPIRQRFCSSVATREDHETSVESRGEVPPPAEQNALAISLSPAGHDPTTAPVPPTDDITSAPHHGLALG